MAYYIQRGEDRFYTEGRGWTNKLEKAWAFDNKRDAAGVVKSTPSLTGDKVVRMDDPEPEQEVVLHSPSQCPECGMLYCNFHDRARADKALHPQR